MVRKTIISLFFFFAQILLVAQNKQMVDSLVFILQAGGINDSSRFEILKKIAFNHPNPGKSFLHAKEAFELAEQMGDPIRKARALEELSLSQRGLGNLYESMESSLKALEIYEGLGLKKRLAGMYLMIGTNHIVDKNFGLALDYLSQAEEIYDSMESLSLLSSVYINMGEVLRLMNRLDSAELYTTNALDITTELGDRLYRGYSLGNLGMINAVKSNSKLAERQLSEAIDILNTFGDFYSVSIYMSELGKLAFSIGQYEQAEEKYLEAYRLAEEFNLKEQLRDFSALLVDLYQKTNNHEQALAYQKNYQVYQDSLVNVENIRAISQLTANYELDKRKAEITLLNENAKISRYRASALLGCLVLFLMLIMVLYRASKKRKKANALLSKQKKQIEYREKEKELFLNELNHRTKNNLQTISSILSLQSRQLVGHPSYELIADGKSRIDALSLIHQKLYQDAFRVNIQVKEYLEELVKNLVYGYVNHVDVATDIVEVEMDVDKVVPLALIVNELITNSLKYAFELVKDPWLGVKLLRKTDDLFQLEVSDNGPGIVKKGLESSTSFGHKLINSLVLQIRGEITYFDNNPGCGWRIIIVNSASSKNISSRG